MGKTAGVTAPAEAFWGVQVPVLSRLDLWKVVWMLRLQWVTDYPTLVPS